MLRIVIRGTYYKEDSYFSKFNSRQKKQMVYFDDYDDVVDHILSDLSYSEILRLKINLYNYYHDYLNFTYFGEVDINGGKFTGYKIDSDVIDVGINDLAKVIPNKFVKNKYFIWDNIKERYVIRSSILNSIKLDVV